MPDNTINPALPASPNTLHRKGGVNLLMAVHCHQPIGNFDSVFEEAFDKAYLPFIKVLQRHPKIKVALHYSGCLLDWLKEKRPDFLETLKRLVNAHQIEMVAGGYHEPILPLIPDGDKLGQLKTHIDFIKKETGYRPKGAWLTERVWEPYLAKIFSQAGLAYTVVDDSHFELAGKKVEEILGYYLTEEEGFTLAIFPSSKRLRYNMPFKLPQETIDYLRSVATPGGTRAVTFGDDGEKFGLWPKTYKWVYEEGWLEKFFNALEENSDWIRVMTPSEYLEGYEPLGRIYIPCASYPEMLEWSGGYFRNFLVKYPEANWMHKRMLYVSEKLEKLKAQSSKLKAARESLYRSQCNCAYWHGVFGGLYLHHLRAAVYKNIIDAQKAMAGLKNTKAQVKAEQLDIDKDGSDEIIFENGPLAVYVGPRQGGAILELDYRPKSVNLINTLARRPETYHAKIGKFDNPGGSQNPGEGVASIHDVALAKEANLNDFLCYDRHGKSGLIDHFLSSDSILKDFSKAAFKEEGDFVNVPYKYDLKKEGRDITCLLERQGAAVKLDKAIRLEAGRPELDISYRLKNALDKDVNLWFGSEFNFSLKAPGFYDAGERRDIKQLEIKDEWFKVVVEYSFNKNAGLWFYPLETISGSESGLERTYQGLCLLFHWQFALKPKQAWSVGITLKIK